MMNLFKRKPKLKKGKDILTVNAALLNAVTPIGGIEFKRNMFHFGENLGKVYAIIKYPNAVEIGWLAKFSNIPQASSVQVFLPCDNGALIEHLSRSITQNMGIAESTREPLDRQRAMKAAEDAEKLMRQIDQNGEIVGYMCNFVMATAKSDDELEKVCRRVESTAAAIGCKIRALPNLQKQAFMSVAPFYGIDDEIMLMTRNNVPLSTWIGGMPRQFDL